MSPTVNRLSTGRRARTVALALGLTLLASGCGAATGSKAAAPAAVPRAKSLTPVSFETTFIPTANDLPWYLAQARGYFKRNGLSVKIVTGKGAVATAEQVAAGNVDIAQTDLAAMALGRAKGESLRAFLVELPKSSFGLFAEPSIKSFADLKGKSILVTVSGSDADFLLPPVLKEAGLTTADVHLIGVPASQTWTEYMSGKADAVVADLAADAPLILPKRPSNELYFSQQLNVLYLGLVARPAYIAAHPKVIAAFAKATQEGMRALLHDPAAVTQGAEYMARTAPGTHAAAVEAAWKNYAPFVSVPAQAGHPLGWMPPSAWDQTVAILRQYAGFPASIPATDLYTNRFVGN